MNRRVLNRIRETRFRMPSSISLKFDSSYFRYSAHCACVQRAFNLEWQSRGSHGSLWDSRGLIPMNSMIFVAIFTKGECLFNPHPVMVSVLRPSSCPTWPWDILLSSPVFRRWSPKIAFGLGIQDSRALSPLNTISCSKPVNPAYPRSLRTLRGHLRKTRIDRRMSQSEIAAMLKVSNDTK